MADQFDELVALPVRDQGIQGQMHLNAPDVAVFHRLGEGLGSKVFRALAGIKHSAA